MLTWCMWPSDAGLEIGKCTFYSGRDVDAVECRKSMLSGCSNRGNGNSLRDHIFYEQKPFLLMSEAGAADKKRDALITQNQGNRLFFLLSWLHCRFREGQLSEC